MAAAAKQSADALEAMLNKPVPLFELTDLQGKHWSLAELRGKVVVLNFWFTSCVPCIEEMPQLNKLSAAYDPKAVVFLALTFSNAGQTTKFLQQHTFDYTVQPVDEAYHIGTWPTSIVIDQNGIVQKIITLSNPTIRELLATAIDHLL